jgi:hypothetical protein
MQCIITTVFPSFLRTETKRRSNRLDSLLTDAGLLHPRLTLRGLDFCALRVTVTHLLQLLGNVEVEELVHVGYEEAAEDEDGAKRDGDEEDNAKAHLVRCLEARTDFTQDLWRQSWHRAEVARCDAREQRRQRVGGQAGASGGGYNISGDVLRELVVESEEKSVSRYKR